MLTHEESHLSSVFVHHLHLAISVLAEPPGTGSPKPRCATRNLRTLRVKGSHTLILKGSVHSDPTADPAHQRSYGYQHAARVPGRVLDEHVRRPGRSHELRAVLGRGEGRIHRRYRDQQR